MKVSTKHYHTEKYRLNKAFINRLKKTTINAPELFIKPTSYVNILFIPHYKVNNQFVNEY